MDLLSQERLALLRLAGIPGVGNRRLWAAVRLAGSARRILAMDEPLRREALRVRRAEPAPAADVRQMLDRCRALGVQTVGWHEPSYPPRLRHLEDPPPVLYVLGDLALFHRPQVAVVGSRRATGYGRRTARALGRDLAREGVVVLSGMALGVDGEAHRGALEAGGPSTAVLASGPERPSPRQHRRLHAALIRQGAVASEHPPGTPSLAHHFPVRNRLMAALARSVVVVEATLRSGALITVREAAALGRDVLAVPGPVDAPTSAAPNQLLTEGAAPALDAAAVLEVLKWETCQARESAPPPGPGEDSDADGLRLWQALGAEPRSADTLAREAGLPLARTLAALTRLEMEGWARQEAGLTYARGDGDKPPPRQRVLPLKQESA